MGDFVHKRKQPEKNARTLALPLFDLDNSAEDKGEPTVLVNDFSLCAVASHSEYLNDIVEQWVHKQSDN